MILAYLLVRSGNAELEVIKTELREETEPTVLVGELPLIEAEGMWRMRRMPVVSRRLSVRLVRRQNRVALRRGNLRHDGRSVDGDGALERLRREVAFIRGRGFDPKPCSDHGE